MSMHRRNFMMGSLAGLGATRLQPRRGGRVGGDLSGARVLVIGGPGNIGTSTLEVLLEKRCEVGLYTLPESYSEEWAEKLRFFLGDRNDSAKLKSAFEEFNPDYVVDFVLFRPEQAREILKIVPGRVRQYIYISTVDVSGYPVARVPQKEEDPWVPTTTEYAANKRASEEVFLSAFDAVSFPLTIARPAYSLGATFVLSFLSHRGGVQMIQRIREGRPVLVPGEGGLIQPENARNTGRMVVRLVGEEKAIGRTYHCGSPRLIRREEYVRRIAGVVGREPRIVHVPAELIVQTHHPQVQASLLPVQTRYHMAHSVERFLEEYPDFQFQETVEDGVRAYIDYQEAAGNFAGAGEEIIDDKIIGAWRECRPHFNL